MLQFKNLRSLSVSGKLINLECIQNLQCIESLEIRYAPDLHGLPDLDTWKHLTSFIAYNVEETKGKELRGQLRRLSKIKDLEYSSISKLRKSIWFTTEYEIPFSAWRDKESKLAVKYYKTTVKQLQKATSQSEVKEILESFTKSFNSLPSIETTEREDIATALEQLRQVPKHPVSSDIVMTWFDQWREF